MLLMRIAIPDRPGSLGAVASAMGTVGADIYAVEIVERRVEHVVDDFMLTLPGGQMPDSLVSACTQLDGVQVLWLSTYPEWGLESDMELLTRMTDDPDDAGAILAEAGPHVFHCHWALLLDSDARRVLVATELAPDLTPEQLRVFGDLTATRRVELPAGWLPHWGEATSALAPLRDGRAVVLGRQGGPAWLDSELARLRFLAGMAVQA